MITIRAATPDDAHRLAELRWEFRVARAPARQEHDQFVARCTSWMRDELTTAARWRAWVVLVDDVVVGQVWLQMIEKMPNPVAERERHGYLSNLFVQPAFRDGGVGGRLIEAVVDWARAHQFDRVILWPSAKSVPLYERHGFSHHGDVMELALGPRRQ
jgi:GNAT superfamily N-acetyltransferase